jgi:hypothetical protein
MTKLNIAREEIWPVYRIVSKDDPPDDAIEVDIPEHIAIDFVNGQVSADQRQKFLAEFYEEAAR